MDALSVCSMNCVTQEFPKRLEIFKKNGERIRMKNAERIEAGKVGPLHLQPSELDLNTLAMHFAWLNEVATMA